MMEYKGTLPTTTPWHTSVSKALALRAWRRGPAKASPTETAWYWATMPVACSMTIRLDSAVCSWPASSLASVRAGHVPEQVEDPDDVAPEADGQGMDRGEAGAERDGGEARPPTVHRGQILVDHGLRAPVAVQAGPLGGLELEQLHHPQLLAGWGQDPQNLAGRGQQQAGPDASNSSTHRSTRVWASSTRSKSSTRTSASSTNVRFSKSSRAVSLLRTSAASGRHHGVSQKLQPGQR